MSEHDRHIAHQGADTLEAHLSRELADKPAPVELGTIMHLRPGDGLEFTRGSGPGTITHLRPGDRVPASAD